MESSQEVSSAEPLLPGQESRQRPPTPPPSAVPHEEERPSSKPPAPVKQAREILRTTLGSLGWALTSRKRTTSSRSAFEAASLVTDHEKTSVLATIEDLPAWVFFPDTERAEWVNKILCQFWPFVGDYVKDLILETIEPRRAFFPACIPEQLQLLRGDCKFSIKVKGFKAGIRDLQIHGHLRVVMRPLTKQMPLVGGVTVFFLRPPAIDFTLTNLGQVLEVPGLNDLLKKAVSDQVAAMMVLPNKYSVKLQEHVSTQTLRYSLPCGVLRVEVVAAKDLVKADIGMLGLGKSDPYAIISVGAQEFRTQVIPNTVNPKWNYYCEVVVYQIPGTTLDIEVMDEDQSSKDDFLGRVSVAVSDIESQGQGDMWLTLDDTKSGKIRLRTFWLTLSRNTDDLALQLEEVRAISTKTPLSSAVLIVFLDSAKHLPNASKAAGEPSPQVNLMVGQQERWSSIKHSTNDPVWEEIFYLLLSNPEVQEMEIKVMDNKSGQVLGHLSFRLSRLLKEEGLKVDEPLILLGTGHQAKLQITLQLRILKSNKRRTSSSEPLPRVSRGSIRASEHEDVTPSHRPSVDQRSSPPSPRKPMPPQVPSLDEVVHSTVSPILDSMAMGEGPLETSQRDPQREVLGDPGAGKLQLTLRYSAQRSRMVVVVHRAVNLVHKDGEDLPDPYVKLQLLPDRSKESKRKTQICRNTCNPVFDETMEFEAALSDLEGSTLQVLVNSKSGSSMFSRGKTLGRTQVSLANLDLTKALTDWYELEPDT
ncbi:hypothetical protein MRX96_035531 [Rhipicephalus microplus]